jgi:hypothetical protein
MEGTRANFENLRADCIKALSFASGVELDATADAVREFKWIDSSLRTAETRTKEKKWASVDQAETEWNRIAGKIAVTRNELRAVVWPEQTESKEITIA